MLVKLPSGDQINPKAVTAVRVLTAAPASEPDTYPTIYVVTEYGTGGRVAIETDSLDAAEVMREHIAELINAACHTERTRR